MSRPFPAIGCRASNVFKRELRAHSALQPRAARSDLDGDGMEDFYAFYESGILSLSGRTGAILARHGGGHLGWSIYSVG